MACELPARLCFSRSKGRQRVEFELLVIGGYHAFVPKLCICKAGAAPRSIIAPICSESNFSVLAMVVHIQPPGATFPGTREEGVQDCRLLIHCKCPTASHQCLSLRSHRNRSTPSFKDNPAEFQDGGGTKSSTPVVESQTTYEPFLQA